MVYAIRGATTVIHNDADEIIDAAYELIHEIITRNSLNKENLISIIFTMTNDLNAEFPAVAARKFGLNDVPLMCAAEVAVPGSLEKCIRILAHLNTETGKDLIKPEHVYLRNSILLRPDLVKTKKVITIDGPAGAGKSTLARNLARALDFVYVDTGAMYRTVALKVIREKLDGYTGCVVEKLAVDSEIRVLYDKGVQRMYLDQEDVTGLIRSGEVSSMASRIAVYPGVRHKLVELQRKIAAEYDVVMDGRDIGTYVLPFAKLKLYLDASPEERARRRYEENIEKGLDKSSYKEILEEIIKRDKNDSCREFAPLCKAKDAVLVDSTHMNEKETFEHALKLAEKAFELNTDEKII